MANDMIARQGDVKIAPNTRVTLHFSILLESGDEVDTTRRGKPATFVVGDGNLLPGFERALFGLRPGDDEQIPIPAADAFGPRREENVRTLPRRDFAHIEAPEAGLMVSFNSPDGELPGIIRELTNDEITVDFNHPLAGHNVVFDVSIIRVEHAG